MLQREPEYRRRIRERAAQNEKYADRKWDEAAQERNAVKIISAIKGVEEKLDRAINEEAPKNKSERRRHLWEIGGLWVAAAVGAAAIIFGNIDASEQRRVMQQQLNEMQVQSAIQRAQIKAALQLTIDRDPVPPDIYDISIVLTNTGKSEAIKVRDWRDIAVIPLTHDLEKDKATLHNFDFLNPPKGVGMSPDGGNILAGDKWTLMTQKITIRQAAEAMAGNLLLISYGYVEYSDIFGTFYAVRFCRLLNFEKNGTSVTITLPVILPLPCEKRTEKAPQNE